MSSARASLAPRFTPLLASLVVPSLLSLGALVPGGCAADSSSSASNSATLQAGDGSVAQLAFAAPQDAAQALEHAAAMEDSAYLRELFGPEVSDLGSGDPEVDRRELKLFARAMNERRDIVKRPDGSAAIVIGASSVEFPVPLKQVDGLWMFDTAAGVEAMTNLRIGYYELRTITFLRALPEAQRLYRATDWNNDGVLVYASRLKSSEGQRDGLYWPATSGAPASPLGPYAAEGDASVEVSEVLGYNGYLFRVLDAQGPGAPGGARSYLTGGGLTNGWAVVAYPAIYDASGVMSFLVGEDGVVFEKDLGPESAASARAIRAYDPSGWRRSGAE